MGSCLPTAGSAQDCRNHHLPRSLSRHGSSLCAVTQDIPSLPSVSYHLTRSVFPLANPLASRNNGILLPWRPVRGEPHASIKNPLKAQGFVRTPPFIAALL